MRVSKNHVIYAMDKNNTPVLRAHSGDTIVFETIDCFSCSLTSEAQGIDAVDFNKVNPATGPLFIEGAKAGDTLKVSIKKIDIADTGVSVAVPGLGRFGEKIKESSTRLISVKDNQAHFLDFSIPLKKMVGVIGVAPAGEPVVTGIPGKHGGNLDCTQIAEGAILYLPVEVDGALLAMGDLHATMGDGEVGGAGAEINGEVTVQVEVLKDFDFATPIIETKDKWITLASHQSLDEATNQAVFNMGDFIAKKTGLAINDVSMLMSFSANVIACQLVNPNVTIRVEISKSLLKK
jgi:amidase